MSRTIGSAAPNDVLHLTLACGRYDRTEALRDGRIRPEGVDLTVLTLGVEEIFWRMLQYAEFDVAELSLAGYMIRRARGDTDLIALPVFLSRAFRHDAIFVRNGSGIQHPEDLKGKAVGVPEYQITAAVWVRAMLADEFGVQPRDIRWVQGGLEAPGRVPHTRVQPSGVEITFAPPEVSLTQMLESGAIDALVTARSPSSFQQGRGNVRRLLQDPWKAEKTYFERTRVYPIMHLVAMKADLLQRHPWVAQTLYKAFVAAKDLAIESLSQTSALPVSLPFLIEHALETQQLMGSDFWPYGVEANRHTLETFSRHMLEQELISGPIDVEELFARTTRGDAFRI